MVHSAPEQLHSSDSALESLLDQAPDDFTRVEVLVTRARQMQWQQPQQAICYAQRALDMSERIAYPKGIAEAKCVLGYAEFAKSQYDRAAETLEEALTTYSHLGDRTQMARAATLLAGSYFQLGRYDKSLLHLTTAQNLWEELGNRAESASILSNIASVYQELGQLDLALENYLKALEQQEETGDHHGIAITANNIASVYLQLGHFETARHYSEQALAWFVHSGNEGEIATTLCTMGLTYLHAEDYTEALSCFSRALEHAHRAHTESSIAQAIYLLGQTYQLQGDLATSLSYLAMSLSLFRRLDASGSLLEVLSKIAQCYTDANNPRRALRYYKQAIELAHRIGAKLHEARLCEEVSRILENLGQVQTALAFFRRGAKLRRQVLSEETEKLIAVMGVRYEIERSQREKEIYRLRNVELANALKELQEKSAALEQAYSDLEQQQLMLSTVNAQLQQVNQQLQDLDRQRNELLAIVTHDLKNLVASIKISAETLRHPRLSSKPQLIEAAIERVLTTAQAMNSLIISLLDINALESGRLTIDLQPTAAHQVARSVVDRYIPHAESKRITILSSIEPCWALADPQRLGEVYDNLISNSVKYTPHGGEVRIVLAQRNDVVRLVVSDTGPGFTDEDKKKLFTSFQRLSARPTGGEISTGLGLSIAKRLVDLMHGTIWLESTHGEGAIFFVDIPACELPHPET